MANSTSGFSGIVQLGEVDDYIAPSQICVLPLTKTKAPASQNVMARPSRPNKTNGKLVEIQNDSSADAIKEMPKTDTIKITLNDCLACSGCITSAETLLIEQHSHVELKKTLLANQAIKLDDRKIVAVSFSPESRASLCEKYDVSLEEITKVVGKFFAGYGASYLIDTTFLANFSLEAVKDEFFERRRLAQQNGRKLVLPLLTSNCPGWICYAEKTNGELLLPYLSHVRSPQAVAGAFVKDYLATKLDIDPANIYHVSVMPCFDKKLEAARNDFRVPGTDIPQVNCVISTGELVAFLQEDSFNLRTTESQLPLQFIGCFNHHGMVSTNEEGGTGGFAHMLEYAMQSLLDSNSVVLETKRVRKDLEEMTLKDSNQVVFKAAKVFGFRNIQNVVQKLKRNKCTYDFVEILACPSGCLNGGGQIRADSTLDRDNLLKAVTERFNSALLTNTTENMEYHEYLTEWLGDIKSEKAHKMLYTDFHAVEKTLIMNW